MSTPPPAVPPPICPYCGQPSEYRTESSTVHHGHDYGPIWICPPCAAWVTCHSGGIPKGVPAKEEARRLRRRAHALFDALWRARARRSGIQPSLARTRGYAWLAKELGIPPEECHIGMMLEDRLGRVIQLCEPYVAALREPP